MVRAEGGEAGKGEVRSENLEACLENSQESGIDFFKGGSRGDTRGGSGNAIRAGNEDN